jgi:hypothetical protein
MTKYLPGDRVRVAYDATVVKDEYSGKGWVLIELDSGLGQRAADKRVVNPISEATLARIRSEERAERIASLESSVRIAEDRLAAAVRSLEVAQAESTGLSS